MSVALNIMTAKYNVSNDKFAVKRPKDTGMKLDVVIDGSVHGRDVEVKGMSTSIGLKIVAACGTILGKIDLGTVIQKIWISNP